MPQWFLEGGPIMWPILVCSVVALAIVLEKLFHLRKNKIMPRSLIKSVENLLSHKKTSEALAVCKENGSVLSNILQVGVSHYGKKRDRIKEAIEEIGKLEVMHLSNRINALGTIAHIAPLLGLLGTVLGMVEVFHVITTQGVGNAQSLAGGISQALITTIAGLIVGIPTLVAYHYLKGKVKNYITEIEGHAVRVMDLITGE